MINIEKLKQEKTIHELLEFGIVNVDKPSGPTSFDVSDFVRKKLNLRKTSHFGTLDPKVTGVLPIALNRACKLTGFFLGEDKEYIGVMRIHEEISLDELKKVIKGKFLGKIRQTPPKKSRVKRQEREREIKKFELLEKEGKNVLFVSCVQGGTYIRKLIDDLGKELGIGAHMLELRRIRAGIFTEDFSVNLYDFVKAVEEFKKGNEKSLRDIIIPAEIVSKVYREVKVKEESVKKLLTGKPILFTDLMDDKILKSRFKGQAVVNPEAGQSDKEKIISVFSGEKFIGVYEIIDSKETFAKSKFVFQEMN